LNYHSESGQPQWTGHDGLGNWTSKASSIPSDKHYNGACKQFDIPVFATAETAVYNIPQVNNDFDATYWAIHGDTWSTQAGPAIIIKNTTTTGTFKIHAQLCIPKTVGKNILQIATHGVHYDSRYWDPELDREKQSYVEASLKAGYSILTYDRLGVGKSDILDAYTTVQAPVELEILRQFTLMARNGTLYNFADKAKPSDKAFSRLAPPSKVVHIGHSFGSFLTSAFAAHYPALTDGVILTGYLYSKYLADGGMSSWHVKFAGVPPYERPSGYVYCEKSGIQTVFFGGNPKTAFTQAMLSYGDSLKQPVPIGELASAWSLIAVDGSGYNKPLQYFLPEFDFYICDGDCNGIYDMKDTPKPFPNAKIEVAIQPNTGHALTLHNNATAGYQVMFNFFARHGL
jgi:pimeloyl-ACP methyl ester carboxylesterase